MSISVILADDHAVVRDGLSFLLDAEADIKVVAVAADGRAAVQQAVALGADIVIMDIAMPELNGIDATRELQLACPKTRVIILSMYVTQEHIYRALQAGAWGYLMKESAGSEVVKAIRSVAAGHRYLSHQIRDLIINGLVQNPETIQEGPLDRLSLREREVLQLVVEGHSSSEIADILSLSVKTVETYRSRMMAKLDIHDMPELVKFAIRHGVTTL